MEKDYLSKEEDEKFSRTVLNFNNGNKGDIDEKKKDEIRNRTKIIIYKVSRELLHLSPDESSTIFLDMEEELDKIISSYKVSTATFNHYIKQLCQYRYRRIKQKNYQKTLWENAFFQEEAALNARNYNEIDFLDIKPKEKVHIIREPLNVYSEMDLKEIINFISKNKNVLDYPVYNRMEARLRKFLDISPTVRKRFLIFILTLPRKAEGFDSYDIARVMKTDENAIIRFFDLKNEALGYQEDKIREIQSRASKHWRMMAKLEANITIEHDEEKKKKLRDHYQTQVLLHKKNVRELRRASQGMSRTTISNILGLSRSTITVAIKDTATILELIANS